MSITGIIKMFFGDPVSTAINGIILITFLYVLGQITRIMSRIKKNEDALVGLHTRRKTRREIDKNATMRVVTGTSIDPGDINNLREEYDKICVKYSTISQLISIFPTLGILGTVAGLMYQIQADGIEEINRSIGLALSTTFLALFFTIIVKVYLAEVVSAKINSVEVIFRNYERLRQDLVDKVKLNED